MSTTRSSRSRVAWAVAAAFAILLSTLAITACGSDDFEGTWVVPGQPGAWVIEKDGDLYSITVKANVDDATGLAVQAQMDGDRLKIVDPTGGNPEPVYATVSGDKLTYTSKGEDPITLERLETD